MGNIRSRRMEAMSESSSSSSWAGVGEAMLFVDGEDEAEDEDEVVFAVRDRLFVDTRDPVICSHFTLSLSPWIVLRRPLSHSYFVISLFIRSKPIQPVLTAISRKAQSRF